jgi:hypothetical protein
MMSLTDEDGIDGPHEEAWADSELEVIELRATVRQLKAELDLMRAEAGAAKCFHCRMTLPVRAFQCADLTEGRSYCSARCWINEARDRANEEF